MFTALKAFCRAVFFVIFPFFFVHPVFRDELETEAVSKARSAFRALGAERDKDLRASNEVVKADYASRLATLTKETENKIGEKNRAFKEFVENTTKQERMKFLLEISEVTHCHLLDMHEDLFGAFAAR